MERHLRDLLQPIFDMHNRRYKKPSSRYKNTKRLFDAAFGGQPGYDFDDLLKIRDDRFSSGIENLNNWFMNQGGKIKIPRSQAYQHLFMKFYFDSQKFIEQLRIMLDAKNGENDYFISAADEFMRITNTRPKPIETNGQSDTITALESTQSKSNQVVESSLVQTIENIRRDQAAYFAAFKQVNTLNIDSTILPSLSTPADKTVELQTVLLNHTANSVILLYGAGGIGKSYIIFACCEELQRDETFNEYGLVPIFVPMKEVVGSEESPVLQYVYDNQFASLNCGRDTNSIKIAVRDLALNGAAKFVFFLDGLNEFALSANKDKNDIVLDEIKWLRQYKNIITVVSTRSVKGFENHYKLQVNELSDQQVETYLKCHDNTALIDRSSLKRTTLLGLLRNPLLLALFTKTYSHEYTELNDMRMETHADVLRLCVEYQKNRLQGTSRANFALDILLPLVTLSTDMKLQLEARSLAEELRHELQIYSRASKSTCIQRRNTDDCLARSMN